MKKSVRSFSLFVMAVFVSLFLVGITACKNWMSGNLFNEIENEVKVASAEEIEVYVRFADNNFGTVSAKCASAQLQQNHILVAKQDVEMEVSAIPNNTFGFKKWAAFSSSKLDPKKNISSMVFDEDYMTKFGINELPESIVVFENAESDTTKCKILQPLMDPEDPDAMIVIVPVVARRATLSARNTYPKTGSDGVVRNQRIVLSFDKPMNFATFVTCTNPSGTFDKDSNGENIYYRKNDNGTTEYFYDWNRERIQISVYDTNEKQVDEDIAYGYFQRPVPDETNPRKIIISPNFSNRLPKFAEVNIVISYDVEDSHGYTLTEAIEYYYMVGSNDDTGAPTFTLLSGGRPRFGLETNDWDEYLGYLKEDSSDPKEITNELPADSTNIDNWSDSGRNKPFVHRIKSDIDILVKIIDQVSPGVRNNNASDADIDHFVVRARHLINADGSAGTGALYENNKIYNFDSLKYRNGAKIFDEGEPGDTYKDPEDGYAFPYHLPENIPDGLIKIEVYAVDVTGNSGEEEPFALYVVKDTSAPDIEIQTAKISYASTNTLNEWFNGKTINQLAFKVNPATPFTDTIVTKTGVVPVHPKFMTSTEGSSLYWAFGNAPENMAEKLPVDNSGVSSYDMSNLISSITKQGAMTFYTQLSDDLGNASEIKNIPLKIYYDTILPDAAKILSPQEADKIYPLTGVTGGKSGTFYTRSPSLSLVVSALDSGSANVTETSSGIAGFLVPTTPYNDETLNEALTAENGNLSGLFKAEDGSKKITLDAGSEANNSKQDYYIYSVDYALNSAAAPTTVTVIQDTTGPGITLSDNASYTYDAEKSLFKAKAGLNEKTVVSGGTGTVKGVSKGAYYYNNAQTAFPFHVTLNDEFREFDSGAYQFVVKKSGVTEVARGTLNDDINLSAGTYTIVAYDNLGNETTTDSFVVYQDEAAPVIAENSFHIYGRKFGMSTYNIDTTNYRTVNLQFDANDGGEINSGIRRFTFSGASFAGSNISPLIVTADDKTLIAGTDYIVQTEAPVEGQIPENAYSHIIFMEPRLESKFRVDNIILPAEDGTKKITLMATDATGNESAVATAEIFSDSIAPSITSVSDIALAPSIDGTGDKTSATNRTKINVQVVAKDATSGIRRFYIGDTDSEVDTEHNDAPLGISLISAESKVLANGVELPSTVGERFIELNSPSISTSDVIYTITNINVPDTTTEGTKTVYVVLFDDTELRNQHAVSDTIIYDTTGPAIVITDGASSTYNGTALKKYRSNDTANDVTAVTGGNGNVQGIVTGSYFYSVAEGNASENPGFKFKVELVDQNVTNNTVNEEGTASGAYRFYIGDASGNVPDEAAAYESGSDIYLTEGTYTLVAKDKLGNTTTSKSINVVQDANLPSVSELSIHGKIQGDVESETATKDSSVYVTFKAADSGTGLLKLTVSGNADFTAAELYEKLSEGGDTKLTVFKTLSDDKASVDFMFASPVTAEKTYVVKGVVLTDSDGIKTVSAKAYDRTENGSAVADASIFKDTVAPVTSDVEIISTDKDALHENSLSTVTNDEKVTVLFKAYDVTSGIKKITICDANGNSLLTAGEGGSVVTITHNLTKVTFNGTVTASEILLTDAKKHSSASSEDPFIFEVTNVSMPKVDGNFVQGRNYFLVKVYDDVMNVAPEATKGSIIFDNVPPKPIVDFSASHFYDPKKSRERSKNSFNCYISADGKVFFDNSDYVYFKASGDDSTEGTATAGFWKVKVFTSTSSSFIVTDPLNSTTSLKSPYDTGTSLYRVDESSNKYTKIFVFDAIGNCTELVSGVTEFEILDDDCSSSNSTKKPVVSDYEILKAGTNTPVEGYLNTEDTPVIDIMFKAMDKESGISYFDFFDGNLNANNGNVWNQIISGSPNLKFEVSDDNGVTWKTYKEGAYDYGSEQHYSSVVGGATYNAEKGYFVDETGNLDPYVYFHNYTTGEKYSRAFAFYEPLKPNITYKFKISNISLGNNTKITPDVIRENWDTDLNCNVYVYDCVQMGNSGLEQKIIWDTQKPVIKSVEFAAASGADPNFTSESILSKHDLVITYDEPNDSTYGGASGIQEIKLELTTNVDSVDLSSVDLLSSSDWKLYAKNESSETELTVTKGDVVALRNKTSAIIKINDSNSSTKGSSRKLVIKGLTIAGGDVDMIENIKVSLTDFAGNVSDNTGNTNNVVQIGYDKTAPIMYPVSGNTIVDGKLARSYFKTVFGKPTVLSLHHAASKIHTNTSVDDNMVFNIFPEPGDVIQNYGDGIACVAPFSGTAWEDNADLTELVLRFNKNGSGIQTITLAAEGESVDTWDFRRILFNPSKVKVSIDEGEHWYSPGSSALPYTVTRDTLTFTNSGICPKGENCSVMIKGVMPNFKATYCRHNSDGDYRENIWWSDVIVTSFAGMPNTYSYALALADDVDTPEFTRTKISVTDTSSTDGSFTDGKTIQITGRIQANSTGSVYSSGLWAIQLNGAEFDTTANPQLKIKIAVPDTERRLLLPNALPATANGTELTYTYDSTNDYSIRRTVDKKISDSKIDINPSLYRCSISEDKSTLFLNMPLNPHDGYDFTLSGIKLPENALDGAKDISVKLIKYSGLTNDPDDRYWDYDESNERDEIYKTMFREVEAYYSATEEHRAAVNFAQNRTNSITLDTVPPVISWNGILDDATSHYHSYKDASGVVFYPSSDVLKVSFGMSDTDGSGIYGYYFDDSSTGSSIVSKYTTGSISNYSLNGFNSSTNGLAVTRYLHVMDKVGNITNHPVTYEANSSSTATPTTWKLDSNSPSIKNGVVRHFYGDTPGSRFVLKHYSDNAYHVYHNAETSDISGKFTDVPVADETGGVDQFFSEADSGLYGTMKSSNDTYSDIWTDYRWSTGDTNHYITDKVGNIESFTLTKKEDSEKPELSFYSIDSNKGENSFWPKSNISLSTDESNPTVLYLGGDADEDYIRLILNANDTGTNATGIYKVTVNGTELPVGSYENTVSHLSGRTEFPTEATPEQTLTWLLGKDESKTEGEENGLPYKITITDWVGNETTYWFKLVSDVTAPVLTVGDNSPFTEHAYENTNGNKYFTQSASGSGKQVIFFSENNTVVTLGIPAVSENGSGYGNLSNEWYNDEACTAPVSSVTFGYARQDGTITVAATPDKIYTRDNVGNVLKVEFTKLSSDIEDITSVTGNVLFCYASADTTAKLNVQEGQYVDGTTEVSLGSGTPLTVFTKAAEAKVKITPTAYYKINYSYENSENVGTKLGSGNFSSSNKSVEITVPAGKTYNITIGSSKYAAVSTTYQVQVVQDIAKPDPSTFTFEIEKNAVEPNGDDNPLYKSYLDQANWKLYYNTTNKFYPHFKVSGINDGTGSGVVKIGLNSKTTIPGSNFFDVGADGIVSGLWGSFQGNMSGDNAKALYVSDKVGNGSTAGDYAVLIEGVVDQTAPTISWSIEGLSESDKYTTGSGNDTVVYVNSSSDVIVSVADNEGGSGLSGAITSPVSFDANKEISLAYSDNVANESKIKIVSDVDAPIVKAVSHDTSTQHLFIFKVKDASVKQIHISNIGDAEKFQIYEFTIGGEAVDGGKYTKTGNSEIVTITFNNPIEMNESEVAIRAYYGDLAVAPFAPDSITVDDVFGKTGIGEAEDFESPSPLLFSRITNFVKSSVTKVRSVIIPENHEIIKPSRSSEKGTRAVTESSVVIQTEKQIQSPAAKVTDTVGKKNKQDIRRRVSQFEKSEEIVSEIPDIQTVEKAVTDIIEETTERREITTSENISKEVEIFDKNIANSNDDVYNDSNIAKSVVISVILLLIIFCSIFMFWVLKKKALQNKKN